HCWTSRQWHPLPMQQHCWTSRQWIPIPVENSGYPMASKVFQLGDRITLLPVLHGSGDCALSVRALMLEARFDALAVPLPASFQATVEQGVLALPAVSLAAQ